MPQGSTTRKRSVGPTRKTYIYLVNPPSKPSLSASGLYDHRGTQITVSEGHHWPPSSGLTGDLGGPFYTTKQYVEGNPFHFDTATKHPFGNQIYFSYTGPFRVSDAIGGVNNGRLPFPADGSSTDSALRVLGTTAIARCEPTNSLSDLSTAVGETYRDGLPYLPLTRVLESRIKAAKLAGEEFLNLSFGWLPFVSDLTSLSKAASHAHSVISQYERDSGKVVRRKYNFPSVYESSESIYSTNVGLGYAAGTSNAIDDSSHRGNVVRKVETFRERWFSGAFTYHLPSDSDSRLAIGRAAQEAEKLLGSPLSPETLWNLTPWSWAIDWFTNTGDYLHNLNAFAANGLVMRYGYMMEHTIVKHTYSHVGPSGINGKLDMTVPPLVLVTETKKRIQANPFGFGVDWNGLSAFQLSIAAALGLSRSS